jgi:hypothetical protein
MGQARKRADDTDVLGRTDRLCGASFPLDEGIVQQLLSGRCTAGRLALPFRVSLKVVSGVRGGAIRVIRWPRRKKARQG